MRSKWDSSKFFSSPEPNARRWAVIKAIIASLVHFLSTFSTPFPLKPAGQLEPNFVFSLLWLESWFKWFHFFDQWQKPFKNLLQILETGNIEIGIKHCRVVKMYCSNRSKWKSNRLGWESRGRLGPLWIQGKALVGGPCLITNVQMESLYGCMYLLSLSDSWARGY